jgi:hypothetical protein
MQYADTMGTGSIRQEMPLLARFLAKLVVDALPAALASIVGGFLITHYQISHQASRPAAAQAVPASAEMMALVRDEHTMIVDYLRSQMAAEKSRHAAEDQAGARAAANARIAAEAEAAAAAAVPVTMPTARVAAATPAAKPVASRAKLAAPAAPAAPRQQPLVTAQAEAPIAALPPQPPAPESPSLLAKTLDIKDHVMHATWHAVTAIGSIPSWLAGRIGGDGDSGASPEARQFTTAS